MGFVHSKRLDRFESKLLSEPMQLGKLVDYAFPKETSLIKSEVLSLKVKSSIESFEERPNQTSFGFK